MSAACSTNKFVVVDKSDKIEQYLALIEAHNQRVTQVKASLDIRAQGLLGSALHEEADVVVQLPHFMYWSLRSFFGMPSLIVASNGEFLTAYDFSGQHERPYQVLPLRPQTFFEVMEFRLHPLSIVYLLTQKIPLEDARNIEFGVKEKLLEMNADLSSNWHMRAIFDQATDLLICFELKNQMSMIHYTARYQNYRLLSGILFPSSLVLLVKGKSRSAKLDIEFTHTELNGQLVLPDVFYVRPH